MEIAYDLVEAGVSPVRLAVRTPPNILLRSRIGDALALMLMRLPPRLADAVASRLRRMAVGDLGAYGLPSPAVGVFSRLRQEGATPTIVDKEIIAAIRARRIAVVAGVASLEQDGARLVDDTFVEANVIIAATGYRSGLPKMLARLDDLDLLDARGYPRQPQGEEAAPGLRFIGFRPMPAALGRLGRQARRIARGIAQRSREDPALGRTADAKGTPA
jgi:putative flavoprotein involved in K+ transport